MVEAILNRGQILGMQECFYLLDMFLAQLSTFLFLKCILLLLISIAFWLGLLFCCLQSVKLRNPSYLVGIRREYF